MSMWILEAVPFIVISHGLSWLFTYFLCFCLYSCSSPLVCFAVVFRVSCCSSFTRSLLSECLSCIVFVIFFLHAEVLSSLLSPSYLFIISQAQVSFLFILSSFERCIHHFSTTTHCQLSPSFIFLSFPDQASFPFFL